MRVGRYHGLISSTECGGRFFFKTTERERHPQDKVWRFRCKSTLTLWIILFKTCSADPRCTGVCIGFRDFHTEQTLMSPSEQTNPLADCARQVCTSSYSTKLDHGALAVGTAQSFLLRRWFQGCCHTHRAGSDAGFSPAVRAHRRLHSFSFLPFMSGVLAASCRWRFSSSSCTGHSL